MKKWMLICSLLMLNGCAFYSTPKAKVWVLCYKEDSRQLSDGTYESNELHYKCGKKIVGVQFKLNAPEPKPKVFDFKKRNETELP